MITPSFGLTATERVLPKLALDFTTASLDPRVTFTRALNTATRVNSSGFIEVVNADLPRFDYDPITLACKGLLIEESRMNYTTNSQALNSWTPSNIFVGTDVAVSPDGTQNAELLRDDATLANVHRITGATNAITGTITASCYAKVATGTRYLTIGFTTSSSAYITATFDLQNVTVTQTLVATYTGASSSIVPAGNGWYRCSATATATSPASFLIGLAKDPTFTNGGRGFQAYDGDNTTGLYVWGAQLEAGAFPTSYIPTTTTSLTRNADVATMTGTNFSDWYNATQGTLFYQYADTVANASGTSRRIFAISDGTVSNVIAGAFGGGGGVVNAFITTVGVSQTAGSFTATMPLTNTKAAFAYKENDTAFSYNGVAAVVDNTVTLPTGLNQAVFGSREAGGILSPWYINGHIQKIAYYPQRLTNAELAAFTK